MLQLRSTCFTDFPGLGESNKMGPHSILIKCDRCNKIIVPLGGMIGGSNANCWSLPPAVA